MGFELVRKFVISSMRICYRSVVRHPFLVGMVFLLISLYRLFPLLFSLLVYASPVIVSTALLLGTLLSFGQPNIPEIEKEPKPDHGEIHNLQTKVMSRTEIVGRDGSSASQDAIVSRTEVGDKSFGERTSVASNVSSDDNAYVEVDKRDGSVDNSVSITDDKSQKLQSEEEHVTEESMSEMGFQGTDVEEEKAVLENHYSQLQVSEDESNALENDDKLRKRGEEDEDEDEDEDEEGSDSGSDGAESSSPDASMADIIPMLDELHPLLAEESEARQPTHMSHDGTDAASEHSLVSSDSSSESNDDDIANQEDLEVGDDEEEEAKHSDKEDETRSAITWTEDDQKNLMNLGTSELERNRRLENLIARRRARKNMRMQAEMNLIDWGSADLSWNVAPISTARKNPFDLPYDSSDNVPGSAPSLRVPRRNPFDLPYDSSEEKPDLVGDAFQQDFVAFQPKGPFFRRHESFNVGPSVFGASRQERQEIKPEPYFVPEQITSDGTSYSSFQRELSEPENKDHVEDHLSREAELSSEKEHEHAAQRREHSELISAGEHAPEAREHVYEHVNPGSQSFEDDGIVESMQVAKGDDSLEEAKINIGDVTDHQEVASGLSETDNVAPSMEPISDAVHLNLGDQESHSSGSSSSSSSEVIEHIYDEKEGKEMAASVPETAYYFVDRGNSIEKSNSDITSLVVEESQPKDPIYDSSPPPVRKNLSSSSISADLQGEISERGHSPPTLERTSSFSGRESEEIVQKIEEDSSDNNAEFVDSLEQDAAEEIGSRSITDHNLNDSELNLGPSVGEDHLHEDKSFQHTKDQLQSSSSVADLKEDSTDSSHETRYAEDELSIVPDNEEPALAGQNISTSLPDKALPETEDHAMDMEASHQLEQIQDPSSNCYARSDEAIHEGDENMGSSHHKYASKEKIMSQPEELSLSDRSMDKPLAEDSGELQSPELEQGQVPSSNCEAQISEVVHEEAYERLGPTQHQFMSEEKVISQPEEEFSLSDRSMDTPSIENPEVLQVQVTSNNLDNLQTQELEHKGLLNIYSALSAEPDEVEFADEIKEIEENLLEELDAVGDFSVTNLGSTSNEMKHDPHPIQESLGAEHGLNSNGSEDVIKSQNEKEIISTEVAGASEAEVSRTKSIQNDDEVGLPQKTKSSEPRSNSASPEKVIRVKENENSKSSSSSSSSDSDKE